MPDVLVGPLAPHLDLLFSVDGTDIVTGAGDSLVLRSPYAMRRDGSRSFLQPIVLYNKQSVYRIKRGKQYNRAHLGLRFSVLIGGRGCPGFPC